MRGVCKDGEMSGWIEDYEWTPVSRLSLVAGTLAAVAFIIYALADRDGFLILDYVNLPFHEFGHLFFAFLGDTCGIWGGTMMQLMIPGGIMVYFLIKGESGGTFFSAFWFGENFLNIAVYIGDARSMYLPLAGGGDHDWNIILSGLGFLNADNLIAGIVKTTGWLIMLGATGWFVYRGIRSMQEEPPSSDN